MTKREANAFFIKEVMEMADKNRWISPNRVKLASMILLGRGQDNR
tara:strand:- start:68 stop:202 length:135 start_codon:yes stop_codon:yes gene_type:complete